ncbi:MAG: hypothetical protein NC402_00585 [Prevotella sp.]|nr:hypothetical protein [Prevotella sp.]MCM1074731.1 hypothetical protein [Ruminococcus sp.]
MSARNLNLIITLVLSIFSVTAVFATPVKKISKNKAEQTEKANTVEHPDFAFPETVINNAEVALRQADAAGDETRVIQCAIQLVIANNDISNDRMPQMAALFDSLAEKSTPVASAILYSLEAELYSQVYQERNWTYSNRELPLDTYPSNPQDWSKQLFAKRVLELVNKSLQNSDLLNNTASESYKTLLAGYNDFSAPYYPTIYSILANRSIDYLDLFGDSVNTIPFGNKTQKQIPGQMCSMRAFEIANQWYEYSRISGNVAQIAVALNTLITNTKGKTNEMMYREYSDAYTRYSESPYSAYLLLSAINVSDKDNNMSVRKELLSLCETYIEKFPDSPMKNNVIMIRDHLLSGSSTMSVTNLYSPEQEVVFKVKNMNVPETLYANIFKLPYGKDPYELYRKGEGKLTASKELHFSTDCQRDSIEVNFGKLPVGLYAVTLRDKSEIDDWKRKNERIIVFRVSNLNFNILRDEAVNQCDLQLVNTLNGLPQAGVNVQFTNKEKKKTLKQTVVTNEYGIATLPKKFHNYQISEFSAKVGDDYVQDWVSWGPRSPQREQELQGIVMTDLAIFHPGDTCKFAVVLYTVDNETLKQTPAANERFDAILRNASYERCDTLSLVTDKNGRAVGQFNLPKGGMNGDFRILIISNNRFAGSSNFKVEEYKQPTFFVEIDKPGSIVPPQQLSISGKVMTYSGMPVSDADVKLTIKSDRLYWKSGITSGSYTADIKTDDNGKFHIDLETVGLHNTEFENQRYEVSATATSDAGESQMSENTTFFIGNKSIIRYTGSTTINATRPDITFKYEILGSNEETSPIEFEVKNAAGETVLTESSSSPMFKVKADELPSGNYTLTAQIGESSNTKNLTIFRDNDKTPAKKSALWIPITEITAKKGAACVNIPVGSSYNNYIYYTVANEHGIQKQGLLFPQGTMQMLEVAASVERSSRVWVNFSTMDSCEYYTESVTVIPAAFDENIKVEKVTFRDKINAGGKERWTFRYTLADDTLPMLPVIATMSDKSLNAITPFRWIEPGLPVRYSPISIYTCERRTYDNLYYYYSPGKLLHTETLYPVNISTYGRELSFVHRIYGQRGTFVGDQLIGAYMESTAETMNAPTAGTPDSDKIFMSVEPQPLYSRQSKKAQLNAVKTEDMTAESFDDGAVSAGNEAKPLYRLSEMPLAWFKPNLSTNEQGILELSFDAPDFNTTWQLQMLAYNSDMLSNLLTEDIIASKPVMVSTNTPRFLRTGDRIVLAATIYNNSDKPAEVDGKMEIFNPLNNSVITSKEFKAENVPANGSRVIAIEFTVPSDLEFIGFKTLGTVPGASDGEQSLISIQPSSSPVLESYPFYLASDSNTFTLKLPHFNKDAQISLQYCDNPVWECVTVLPDMSFDSDASILSHANQLYGNSIAAGLIKQYPKLGNAIKQWSEDGDSTLVSNLQKNQDLKTVALANTPWVNNAQAETLRKARLINLLDADKCQNNIDEALKRLQKEQTSQGGWAWCSGMESSMFITGQVLWRIAMLKQMGFIDMSAVQQSVDKALSYCERELYKDYVRAHNTFSTAQMLNYLYIRSFFPESRMSADFKQLKTKALKEIENNWKEFDIYNKATAATLLWREKESVNARTILESLNQFASKSAERGMWFDNLRSGVFSHSKLVTTAQVLEAFNEISPASPSVDLIRQWLIIERQAQDWGEDAQLAEVIYTILTSDTNWTDSNEGARIYLNDRDITPSSTDKFTGAFTLPLKATEADRAALRVEKSGNHRSWGGVIAKYIAPIADIKEFSESDVTISKRILIVEENENGTSVRPIRNETVKRGQKIRVQLTVTSARDIDYAVITDERGGFMSPVEQLSKYMWKDAIGYYREIKNAATNFFIPRLPKGNFLIEYDCFASQEGEFSTGIATLQSLYAPALSAHSAGELTRIKK